MAAQKLALIWLRRDLRLEDHTAIDRALALGYRLQFIFIFDTEILGRLKEKADARVDFIHQVLHDLNGRIAKLGGSLHVAHGRPHLIWPDLIEEFKPSQVFWCKDYEPQAISRDVKISELLLKKGVSFEALKDQVIFEENDVVKDDGTPYTVFTPYKKKWLKALKPSSYRSFTYKLKSGDILPSQPRRLPSLSELGFKKTKIQFHSPTLDKKKISSYDENRDFPAVDGTTHLGIHFRFGTISVREAVRFALQHNEVWLSELIWREFFMQILFHFPHVENSSFRPQYDAIPWRNREDELEAWKQGKTGFPIVDAGMRELNETGSMHNRVRMIAASFLVKDLLIDWRLGERYFAEKLLDYDLAANNGNWQWVAGTGCDAAPYFRVFSPEQQTKKFDPENRYIEKWIPELKTSKYPEPIVDHSSARIRAVLAYKKALKK